VIGWSFPCSIGVRQPCTLWRRCRLWQISRYSNMALASSTRVFNRVRSSNSVLHPAPDSIPVVDRHIQCVGHQRGFLPAVDRPAHHPTGERIQNHAAEQFPLRVGCSVMSMTRCRSGPVLANLRCIRSTSVAMFALLPNLLRGRGSPTASAAPMIGARWSMRIAASVPFGLELDREPGVRQAQCGPGHVVPVMSSGSTYTSMIQCLVCAMPTQT